jgi:hypothetical protein
MGLLRIPVPEVLFPEWHGSEFRVCSDSSHNNTFFNIFLPSSLDHLDAHDRIIIEKLSRVVLVEPDSSHFRGEMNNDITVFDHPCTVLPFPQIDLSAAGNPDIFFMNPFFEKLMDYL